jgi:hypothetical protein
MEVFVFIGILLFLAAASKSGAGEPKVNLLFEGGWEELRGFRLSAARFDCMLNVCVAKLLPLAFNRGVAFGR